MPQCIEQKSVTPDDLRIFATPLVRTEELIVEPQTVSAMLERRVPGTVQALTLSQAAFGPGGNTAQMEQAIKAMSGKSEWADVKRTFWGLSQIFGLPTELYASAATGDPKHVLHFLAIATVAAHESLKYEPYRIQKWLPDSLVLEKSEAVQKAERHQEALRKLGEVKDTRKQLRRQAFGVEQERQHLDRKELKSPWDMIGAGKP